MTGIIENTTGKEFRATFNGNEYVWKPGERKEFRLPVAQWFARKFWNAGSPQLKMAGSYGADERGDNEEIKSDGKGFHMGVGGGPADAKVPPAKAAQP